MRDRWRKFAVCGNAHIDRVSQCALLYASYKCTTSTNCYLCGRYDICSFPGSSVCGPASHTRQSSASSVRGRNAPLLFLGRSRWPLSVEKHDERGIEFGLQERRGTLSKMGIYID